MQFELASPTGLVRTILLVLALFFVSRILGRLLTPLFRGSNQSNSSQPRKEGEVRIEFPGRDKKSRKNDPGDGEYIDYKEVD